MKLTSHLNLVQRLRKSGSITSLSPFPFIFTFATQCVLFDVNITQFLLGLCQTVLTSTYREAQTELFVAVVIDVTDGDVVLFEPLLQVLRLSRPILGRC